MDRRQQTQPTELDELLEQLPARVLLDRMPGPVIGIGVDAAVAYANPSAVSLFGYVNGALVGRQLQSLLVGCSSSTAAECLALLRSAGDGKVIDWNHVEGYPVHTAVSTPLLARASDPFLMVYITDVTELRWG
ncbi:PAS domain-containing protein [Mycolicibacterium sp. P1-18]|uniref:PAS domain-containing protein n=1 Tax=Mycolicibacterium sp. P1-18 TaxID=2024615 RepID=UPI0021043098|nr:PAS domain-containing protein [Mycolicibacterium sp. P1-18]